MEAPQGIPDDRVLDEYLVPPPSSDLAKSLSDAVPASQSHLASLLSSVRDFDSAELMKESQDFRQISLTELQSFLDWMSSQSDIYNFVIVGKGVQDTPVLLQDVTLSPSGLPHGAPRRLEDSWVMVPNDDLDASIFVKTHPELQKKVSFFAEWPSFGVYDKMGWLLNKTGTAFCWGYLIGAKAALDSLYTLASRHPTLAAGMGLAVGYAAFVSPPLILKALQYVVIGGVFGGAAVATPIFVIGSTGIFVTASMYHAFQASKRVVQSAVGATVKPPPLKQ